MSKKTQKTKLLSKMLFGLLVMLFALPVAVVASDNLAKSIVVDKGDGPVTVFGTVVDKANGEPLIGASVAIWKDGKLLTGTSTNIEGNFRIISPVEVFEVEVTFVGYKSIKFRSNEIIF